MSLQKDYRCVCKISGPGGFKCGCCNPYGHENAGKKSNRRRWRRVSKQKLRKTAE